MSISSPGRPENTLSLPGDIGIVAGKIPSFSVVHKFGFSSTINTTFRPLSVINDYRVPQPAGATALQIAAGGNAADTAAGAGAREVKLQGLNASGEEITATLATAGASASAATTETFIRLFRAWVSESGTYATNQSTSLSNVGAISIVNSGGATAWGNIGAGIGQSQIAAYTIPLGYIGYVKTITMNVSSNKAVNFRFFQRRDILETTPPYAAWRLIRQMDQVVGNATLQPVIPVGPFPALTDLCFFAQVGSTTGTASVDFEILLERS